MSPIDALKVFRPQESQVFQNQERPTSRALPGHSSALYDTQLSKRPRCATGERGEFRSASSADTSLLSSFGGGCSCDLDENSKEPLHTCINRVGDWQFDDYAVTSGGEKRDVVFYRR